MKVFAVLLMLVHASSLADVYEGVESVVLPCHYSGLIPDNHLTVTWSRYDLSPQTVHLRREDDDLQGQNQYFSGRTSMKRDALDFGDFSLTLRKPHVSDSGNYTCSISDERQKVTVTDVQLQVKVHQVKVEVTEGAESVTLPCKITAYLPEDSSVEWTRFEPEFMIAYVYQDVSIKAKEQDKFYCNRTSMKEDLLKTGDLSLTLKYPTERDSGVYVCTIYRGKEILRQKIVLQYVKEKFPSWARGFLILVVLLIVSGGILFHFRHYFMSVYKVEVDSGVESVVLPCKTTVHLQDVRVKWRNSKDWIVHIYQKGLIEPDEQHELYRDRTEMKTIFKFGDLSLTLAEPTERDTDTYTCTVYNKRGKMLMKKKVLLNVRDAVVSFIIAIDFGTAYSGYAFNITSSDKESDHHLKRWGKEQRLETPKTPTCILFNEDGKFMLFGYEAKAAYIKMREEEAKKHLFFENFKMALYAKGFKGSKDMKIKAANGKEMTALKVFTETLGYLKSDALKTVTETTGRKLQASNFTWVLTVPAIWDHSAKQFMREAAAQAGIMTEGDEEKLLIALEPEAASVWCKKLPADGFITRNLSGNVLNQNNSRPPLDQSAGTKYIVVDCGGGTIDMTVHEVLRGGALKELHKASGNDLGGQTVDRKFKEFLREIFCDGVWDEYEQKYPSEVQKIVYNFMTLKQVDEDVNISCSFNLGMLVQKKQNIEKFFESVEGASWNEGSIKISRNKLRSFFAESLQGITERLTEILRKGFSIDYILLVGGFANSLILRQHIIDQFNKRCKVLCPSRAQEAILRGAVEIGRKTDLVSSQKNARTFMNGCV
ncbi:heat shock 70 kDa protein 12A [Kryptolebias marmoratus]|uniref:heat shock 70 kDa protein 12A n=1 Tax=Kryptolebias marmoratus TaxID=37003 RepID=UPI0007F8B588|nr:heat shock 70 kDa protein 12A [Kryptolebias marmoratus]